LENFNKPIIIITFSTLIIATSIAFKAWVLGNYFGGIDRFTIDIELSLFRFTP